MCGLAGWVDYEHDLTEHRHTIEAMTRTMALRGPDAAGIWISRHASLGHRRLAVIDVEGGTQPMLAEDDGRPLACLVYTGEAYNFRELREQLQGLGHRFTTSSDTEVVLRGYLQWGEHVAERLNGMFAFAIWDIAKEQLLLIRDRLGIKPLFYFPIPDGVLFGSEPKAILAHPLAQPRVDREGFRELLTLARNPGRTVYAGMHEVRPGEVIRVGRSGIHGRLYWKLTVREHEHDLPRTIRTVTELLQDIIQRQLVSDVPLCTLLSGGLDSSAITALAYQAARASDMPRVRSFSVDFVDHGEAFVPNLFHTARDTPFVRDFVAHTGGDHEYVHLDSGSLADPDIARAVLRATDFPLSVSNDMFASLYRFFETIRAKYTVALSGESADEVFGGYPWHHDHRLIEANTFPWMVLTHGGTEVLSRDLIECLELSEFIAESYAQALADVPTLPGASAMEKRMRELNYFHLTRYLCFLLDRKDRLSMAVGLEVRVPFCDHRLVEYAFNIPWHMHTFDGREKSILRAAVADLLPRSILERSKSAYPSTQDPRYERLLRAQVAEIMADHAHPVHPLLHRPAIEALLAQPLGNTSMLGARVDLERVRSVATWIKDYRVALNI